MFDLWIICIQANIISGQIVGERVERRSPSLHDDSYLQHKQQKKICVKCMI